MDTSNLKKLTPYDVSNEIRQIQNWITTGDYEAARGVETDLHEAVMHAIAAGAKNPKALAEAALASLALDYPREYGT